MQFIDTRTSYFFIRRMSSNTWRAVSYTLHTIYQRQCYPKCTLDHFHAADESPYSFQTKAAKLIHKVIGLNSYLSRFDVLQAKLKSKKLEKQKPTPTEMEEYIKLSAQLHTSVYSAKHTTRDDIKAFEKTTIKHTAPIQTAETLNTDNSVRNWT